MTIGYPTSQDAITGLVEEHKRLQDEQLRLAIYYAPNREPQDIFLFEVFDGFGANGVDPDKKLFEVAYGARSSFHLDPGQNLRLVVTNPPELGRAMEENWQHVRELREAIKRGRYQLIYVDPAHEDLARKIGV